MQSRPVDGVSNWGTRISFAALLLVFSELIVWQTPTETSVLDWVARAAIYLALGAATLDLLARLQVRDWLSLLVLGGLYGLVNAGLISHIVADDLPVSLVVRPLGAQTLAFVGAFAAYRVLASGRATGPLDFLIALAAGLGWGVWVRWYPVVSDDPIPQASAATALVVTGIALVIAGAVRGMVRPGTPARRIDWTLTPYEWVPVGGVLFVTLVLGLDRGVIDTLSAVIVVTLAGFMIAMLAVTGTLKRSPLLIDALTPPRRPNLVAWIIVVAAFLVAGWFGYELPGDGNGALQSDILFGVLTVFGIVWLPLASVVIGIQAFTKLTREQG